MKYPKIKEIVERGDLSLVIRFENEVCKEVDFRELSARPIFAELQKPAFFRIAEVDQGGGGIVWNDELDISEAYCWDHGKTITERTSA